MEWRGNDAIATSRVREVAMDPSVLWKLSDPAASDRRRCRSPATASPSWASPASCAAGSCPSDSQPCRRSADSATNRRAAVGPDPAREDAATSRSPCFSGSVFPDPAPGKDRLEGDRACRARRGSPRGGGAAYLDVDPDATRPYRAARSEEHTSELQS